MKRFWFEIFITVTILLSLTTVIYLYSQGYRLSKEQQVTIDFKRTGMISARSIPEGANVYINNVLTTATNDTIQALDPGTYNLKITKKGYTTWEKEVEVQEELVTDITAVLILQSLRFEPLTITGARKHVISPSLTKLAYLSKDPQNSGIWVIPLSNSTLGLFKSEPTIIIKDTGTILYSNSKSLEWSPDENELLVQLSNGSYILVDINKESTIPVTSVEQIYTQWQEELNKKREDFLKKGEVTEEILEIAMSEDSLWSPDNKKFLYKKFSDDQSKIEFWVYNLEKPLPVGEKENTLVFSIPSDNELPTISWYSDSYHLILTEDYNQENKTGKISIIRIDGTNKTEIYNNVMFSPEVYSTPSGDKLLFLTSFNPTAEPNIYAIGIR